MDRGDLWWGRGVGGAASRYSGCLEVRNPRWTLGGGGKSLLREAPAQGLPSTCSPVPGLSTGGQTVQEEEDKTPGPQRCEGRGRLACLGVCSLALRKGVADPPAEAAPLPLSP